jgi:hypothetical protein
MFPKIVPRAVCLPLFICAAASVATAAPINVRPAPVGSSSLQTALNAATKSGPMIDVAGDQSPYALFKNNASGGAVATFFMEQSGFSGTTTFGIYDAADPGMKAQIFSGPQGVNGGIADGALVQFMANGDIRVNFVTVATGFSGTFGFYIDVHGTGDPYTLYTEDSLNPEGAAQALIFRGNNQTTLQLPGYKPGLFTSDEWLIAFEDLYGRYSDYDYDDLVVMVESISPVPEPTTLLLLGLGSTAFGYASRRRRKAQLS